MHPLAGVTAWAAAMVASLAAAAFGPRTRASTHTPGDVERLPPGATRWTPLGHRRAGEGLLDAAVLPDGRLAVSAVVTMSPDAPRPSDVWDPRSGRWSEEMAVVPQRVLPQVSVPADEKTRWASLGDGRALLLKRHFAGEARVRIEPGARELPRLEVFPEALVAAEFPSGAFMVVTREGDSRAAFWLPRGADAWTRVSSPPASSLADLQAGPAERAVLSGLGEHALFADGRWTALPTLREPRHGAVTLALSDGSVVVAGGLLLTERQRARPRWLALRAAGALGALLLARVAVRALGGAARPPWWTLALGLALGFGALPLAFWALLRRVLRRLAWH